MDNAMPTASPIGELDPAFIEEDLDSASPLGGQEHACHSSPASNTSEQPLHNVAPLVDTCAKFRWLLEYFVNVSKKIYNCGCEITVDKLIVHYKGKYCKIS
jgi:hypothetical protein